MAQSITDAVYKDLKQKGLDLSVPTILVIPNQETNKSSTFLTKLGSMLNR